MASAPSKPSSMPGDAGTVEAVNAIVAKLMGGAHV
jgi:hypothetical protein